MPPAPNPNIASGYQDAPRGNLTTIKYLPSPASHGHGEERLSSPALRPNLSRHYTSLQEHADDVHNTPEASEDVTKTRQGSRRDGFTWGQKSAYESYDEQRRQIRDPLPPEKSNRGTPPPLEELLRQTTNDDADTAHNERVADRNRTNSQLSDMYQDTFLPTPTTEPPVRRGGRRSSIALFARGLVRHVSDLTMASVPDVTVKPETTHEQPGLRSVSSAYSSKDGKEARKPSFVSQTIMEDCSASHTQLRATSSAGNSSRASVTKTNLGPLTARGSLRDRREAAFGLSLPLPEPRLPSRALQYGVTFSSVVPARPCGPRTAKTRETHKIRPKRRSSPNAPAALGRHTRRNSWRAHDPNSAMPPDDGSTEPSQLARLERHLTKFRDRYHMARPKRKGNRSSARSGTSEDALAQPPNGSWTPEEMQSPSEAPMRTNAELRKLCQTSRTARAGRWRWPRSTTRSSEGTPQVSALQSPGRTLSINPFKRSARIEEHGNQDDSVPQSPTAGRFWWIGKQPGSTPTPAKPAPPNLNACPFTPHDFASSGSHRVSTASTVDSSAKVGRQLADFAFDDEVGSGGMKSREGPEGLWDSDALLMSYRSPESDLGNDTDEEGPEGPRTIEYAPRGFTVECNPGFETPGIATPPAPSGYMEARRIPTPQSTPRNLSPDTWFRVEQCVTPGTPLTPRALQELEKRRKFEWIVPEHLPNSPLCPLHPKYKGYSIGKCFWHATKSKIVKVETGEGDEGGHLNGTRTVRRGMRGWEVGTYDSFPQDSRAVRRRRLASLVPRSS